MEYILELLLRVAMIYGGIALGFVLKLYSKAEELGKILTTLGVNIIIPLILIIVCLELEDFSSIQWGWIIVIALLSSLFSMGISFLLLFKNDQMTPSEKGAELSAVSFMNAVFYPFPLIIGIVGLEGLIAASVFLVTNMILRNTLGAAIGFIYGTKENLTAILIIKKLFLFPPTIAIVLGLLLRVIIGQVITSDILIVGMFRDGSMFIMLAVVGISFKFPLKHEWKEIPLLRGVISRYGGGGLAVLLLIFLPLPLITKLPLIIQSIAPPAVNNTVYARYFNLDALLTSRFITLLTLIALIFLPFEIILLLLWNNSI